MTGFRSLFGVLSAINTRHGRYGVPTFRFNEPYDKLTYLMQHQKGGRFQFNAFGIKDINYA